MVTALNVLATVAAVAGGVVIVVFLLRSSD